MKIILLAKFDYGAKCLKELIKYGKEDIVGVVTEWKKSYTHNRVIDIAKEKGIPLFIVDKIDDDLTAEIKKLEPDIICVASFGLMLPQKFIKIAKYGCINIHPSLLPKYRGSTPIYQAIINNEKKIGVTSFFLSKKIDAGDVILQKEISIEGNNDIDTGKVILQRTLDRISELASQVLIETIKLFRKGRTIRVIPQNEKEATYFSRCTKEQAIFILS